MILVNRRRQIRSRLRRDLFSWRGSPSQSLCVCTKRLRFINLSWFLKHLIEASLWSDSLFFSRQLIILLLLLARKSVTNWTICLFFQIFLPPVEKARSSFWKLFSIRTSLFFYETTLLVTRLPLPNDGEFSVANKQTICCCRLIHTWSWNELFNGPPRLSHGVDRCDTVGQKKRKWIYCWIFCFLACMHVVVTYVISFF